MARQLIGSTRYTNGLVYSNPDIRACATGSYPAAVYKNGHTYFPWTDAGGNVMIADINSAGGSSAGIAYQVGSKSDYSSPADIDHNGPYMCIDNNGYLYVFYGCHTNQLFFRKSTRAYDVTSWGSKTNVTGATSATYPMPFVMPDNTIYVIYRSTSPLGTYIVKSTDSGATWTSNTRLNASAAGNTPYVYGVGIGTETPPSIHIIVNYRPSLAQPTDPFGNSCYMKSLDGGTTWKKADGTTYSLPVDETNLETLEATGAFPGDMKLDSNNRPYLAWNLNSNKNIQFLRYNGSAWTSPVTVSSATRYQFDELKMDVISDSVIDIYAQIGTNPSTWQGGNIVRYRSIDTGQTWSLAETITTDGTSTKVNVKSTLVVNGHSSMKLIWSFGTPTTTGNLYTSYTAPVDFAFKSYP